MIFPNTKTNSPIILPTTLISAFPEIYAPSLHITITLVCCDLGCSFTNNRKTPGKILMGYKADTMAIIYYQLIQYCICRPSNCVFVYICSCGTCGTASAGRHSPATSRTSMPSRWEGRKHRIYPLWVNSYWLVFNCHETKKKFQSKAV